MKTTIETPTTRPLAERITQGRMHAFPIAQYWMVGSAKTEPETKIVARMHTQTGNTEANAELITEAFNVTHETGKTPRQLADERADLITALENMIRPIEKGWRVDDMSVRASEAREVLTRLTP